MRRIQRGRRGLAEIVGTLMLVLIVVAAAIGFSLFLASEQQKVQAEEAAHELKKLEGLKVVSIAAGLTSQSIGEYVAIDFTSLDINKMTISGITINDDPVEAYSFIGSAGPEEPQCFILSTGDPNCPSFLVDGLAQVSIAVPYSSVAAASGSFDLTGSQTVQLSFFTTLGNEFTEVFLAPVAEATVSYVGTNPLLDGLDSYQPSGGTNVVNATIDEWSWDVQRVVDRLPFVGDPNNGVYFGQESELTTNFTSDATYEITLTVKNTFGLVGSTTEMYSTLGKSTLGTFTDVTFNESNLSKGSSWAVDLDGSNVSSSVSSSSVNDSIVFAAPLGTYSYAIYGPAGWHETTKGYSGSVTVSGSPVWYSPFVFHLETYPVSFSESGLPSDDLFVVTAGGLYKDSTTVEGTVSVLTFSLPNGTFGYIIGNIPGWYQVTLPATGLVIVDSDNMLGYYVSEPELAYAQSPS